MNPIAFDSQSEADTIRLGKALAEALPDGAVVSLNGPLGAGKTRLVQAIAAALGIDRSEVVSPTFVLMQEYHGRKSIYHVDAYRIKDDDEFLQLGVEESMAPGNLVLIEWADRVARCLPDDLVRIDIDATSPTTRQFRIANCPALAATLANTTSD